MAVRSFRSLAFCTSVLGALALTQGCVDDGVSLHVICPIPATITDKSCTWDPATMLCVNEGIMNLAATDSYSTELKVESGLRARARAVPPQGEPNGVQVRSATVELRLTTGELLGFQAGADGKPVLNPFEIPVSGYVAPEGLGAMTVLMVTPAHAAQLRTGTGSNKPMYPEIVAAVKLKGRTNGQEDVESGEYVWPIRLIGQSLFRADAQCQPGIPFCGSGIGQDMFAYVCVD